MRRRGIPVLLLSSVIALTAWAADEPPSGVVMALSGNASPPIAVMSEIPSGAPIKLAPEAELTFLHYQRCKLITVAGGTLTVTRSEYNTDGKITAEKDGPCPRVHQLAGGAPATAGGLVMRGVGGEPRWPLDREILFAGPGSGELRAAAIYAEGRTDAPLVRLDVSGHQARLPASAPSLPANQRYLMRLTMAGRAQPVDIPFIGIAPDGPSLFVVLRGQ